MQEHDGALNYLEVLDSLREMEGRRVQLALFERGRVTPVAAFPGMIGALEMSIGQYKDNAQGVAFIPFASERPHSPSTGPDGFYLDASRFENCVRFGPTLRIFLIGVEIVVEPF